MPNPARRLVTALRGSFRRKLLLGLLASVFVLASVTLVVVRRETARQVDLATREAEQRSREAFVELEEFNRARLKQLSSVFTGSVQAAAALEGALETGDFVTLASDVDYEFEARHIPHTLVAFTDQDATPVLAVLDRGVLRGDDPAGIGRLAAQALSAAQGGDVLAYTAVQGRLFSVETIPLELGRPIGTVSVGVPITDDDAARLGSVIGAEVCFVVAGGCVAATPLARGEMASHLVRLAAAGGAHDADFQGTRWRVVASTVDGAQGVRRVIAVPLDRVVGPFERVQRALLLGGLAALLMAVTVAILLSRSLTEPVKALVAATARIGRGDYDTRVTVTSQDEIGVLAKAFNSMAEGLALKQRYRGILDKIVSRDVAEELIKGEVVLGGENREVTTLFADITGFTTITDGMEPARVIALLNECMERLSNVVEDEGGVVDKYVGDEIMALFGAPVTRPHDPLRACRAAVGMQRAMLELNEERARRGEPPLQISVGINSGTVMAGNMGSPSRLNYTVLGDAVNLAARIEHHAKGGQILVSEHTMQLVEDDVVARDIGLTELRGFARPVRLFELLGIRERTLQASSRAGGGHAATAPALALLLAAQLLPAVLGAQAPGELPTLENVRFTSPRGLVQAGISGRLDLEGYVTERDPAWIIPTTSPFLAPRLRLFGDVFIGERITIGTEVRADRGEEPRAGPLELRLDQAFVRLSAPRLVALQAGKFVSPFGGYGQRHHTSNDPFIRPPLPYDHRTLLTAQWAPGSTAAQVSWKDETELWRPWGAPVVWGAPYQWGAMLLGDVGPLSWRAGVMNSAPSSEPEEWGLARGFDAPSVVLNAGVQVIPALRVELSYDRGPWLRPDVAGLPAGASHSDYDQSIIGAEAVFKYGGTVLRGELFHDTWGVPNVGYGVVDVSWYAEAQQTLAAGFTLAARYGRIHFLPLEVEEWTSPDGTEVSVPWDFDVGRLQLGAGWRMLRNAGVRAELSLNESRDPVERRNDLWSAQLWWEF